MKDILKEPWYERLRFLTTHPKTPKPIAEDVLVALTEIDRLREAEAKRAEQGEAL